MELAIVPPLHRSLRPETQPDPLRDRLAEHIEQSVLSALDPARIEALAEDMGAIERQRTHHAGLIVCALVLSALERSTDTEGRLLDARKTYEMLGGPASGKTSFRKKVHNLVPVMEEMLQRQLHALAEKSQDRELGGRLRDFADILIPDGCAFKLAQCLSGVYAGTGTASELKLHAVYSVKANGAIQVTPTAGAVHDSDGFWPESWVPGALYLWDLGYQNNGRFVDAALAGAHVLQRLKSDANPIVLASYGPTGHRRAIAMDDATPARLSDACEFELVHSNPIVELDVKLTDEARSTVARVVCVPHQGEDRYYLTTLPRDVFSAHDIAELYRLRWEVELLFRDWKGAMRLDEVRRLSHPLSLRAAVTASLLAAVLARDIHRRLEQLSLEHARSSSNSDAFASFPPSASASRRRDYPASHRFDSLSARRSHSEPDRLRPQPSARTWLPYSDSARSRRV
jgi:hypothetical protein